MSDFRVAWVRPEDGSDADISLQSRAAAVMLVGAFREEGRVAKAYENVGGKWMEIP